MITTTGKSELLQEFVDSRGTTVQTDRSASVLRGVKLLGLASRNGRRYRESALRRAIPLYEGAKVNVNHPAGDPLSPRDYRDRIGVVRGVKMRAGEGLFGALHYNPKHPLAEQLVWDAEHAPENVGFSHNVLARTGRDGADLVVEAIEKVQSVDLVADPATTSGLYEHVAATDSEIPISELPWDKLTARELQLHRPDLLEELTQEQQEKLIQSQQQIDELSTRIGEVDRRERIAQLLVEHGLPLPGDEDPSSERLISEAFLESLRVAPDEHSLKELIADRAEAIHEAKAQQTTVFAREQCLMSEPHAEPPQDASEFVAAITG